jgi:hypothetical protein
MADTRSSSLERHLIPPRTARAQMESLPSKSSVSCPPTATKMRYLRLTAQSKDQFPSRYIICSRQSSPVRSLVLSLICVVMMYLFGHRSFSAQTLSLQFVCGLTSITTRLNNLICLAFSLSHKSINTYTSAPSCYYRLALGQDG